MLSEVVWPMWSLWCHLLLLSGLLGGVVDLVPNVVFIERREQLDFSISISRFNVEISVQGRII